MSSGENRGQRDVTQGHDDPRESQSAKRVATDKRAGKHSDDAAEFTIALYSDPGRTSLWVRRLLDEQGHGWSRGAKVVHKQTLIPLRSDATLDLGAVQDWARDDGADITLIITEIPRMAGRRPKRAELHFAESLAVISFPALGPVNIRRCLRRELRRCVDALVYHKVSEYRAKGGFNSQVEDQEGYETVYTTPRRFFPGRTWTTLGMVAANEPLLSLPKLSGVFAAAAATGAFGVFFSTIWEMASHLPAWRLSTVSVIAVVIVVLWLMLSHGLWERTGSKRELFMYNASTVQSLLVSVAALYVLLFLGILVMGLTLIDPGFMEQTLDESATFQHYVDIAWLSASLGTVAGAIGSNFDDDTDLRNLTQGSREAQRYPRDERQR